MGNSNQKPAAPGAAAATEQGRGSAGSDAASSKERNVKGRARGQRDEKSSENSGGSTAEPPADASAVLPTTTPSTGPRRVMGGQRLYCSVRFVCRAVWPVITIVYAWALYLEPATFQAVNSQVPLLWKPPSAQKSADTVVPLHPKNLRESFLYGRLTAQCNWGICPSSTLREAARVSGREMVTSKELLEVEKLVVKLDANSSIINRLSGILSFVNAVWFFSIVGIVMTAAPVLDLFFGRFIRTYLLALARVAYASLRPTLTWMVTDLPITAHKWGIIEASAYLTCMLLVNTAAAYPVEHIASAEMIALTGAIGFIPSVIYSLIRIVLPSMTPHRPASCCHGLYDANAVFCMCCVTTLLLAPLALRFDSSLMGFFAVSFVYQAIGFSAFCFGLGFAIGFRNDDSLARCCVTSKTMLVCYSALLVSGIAKTHLVKPFAFGIMVWGSFVYFLALLIISSRWHPSNNNGNSKRYTIVNLAFVLSVTLYSFLGFEWQAPALKNTAITFLVLWLMEKQFELLKVGVLSTFFGCLMLFWSSHHLSTHPDFIVKMFEPASVLI